MQRENLNLTKLKAFAMKGTDHLIHKNSAFAHFVILYGKGIMECRESEFFLIREFGHTAGEGI